ncbi:ENTH/VHS family protein [Striga hermonthica]|uniref:ENTH/VHS family protein n=1 Tax=Striga hermonthica TaxID=68872 RepID=A0A9N7MSF2_STRHE|nr:ENTH/VHS family protein [Striga hermonthica]
MASINTNINSGGANIGFHELKKQASFFLKEKIKSARLALTDVTPAQLLAEEATNGDPGCPDARTLKMISKAAFEVDDYWRIVDILHRRLVRFEKMNWRPSYKALIVNRSSKREDNELLFNQ